MMAVVDLRTLSFMLILLATAVAIPVRCRMMSSDSSYGDILQKVGKCGFQIPNDTVQPQLRLVYISHTTVCCTYVLNL